MAIDDKLKIRRDQLAKFIDDHDTIKQFERLFEYINTFVVPDNPTEAAIQNLAHPIGEEYWQLPGKKPPMELYPAQTWEDISTEFAGDFFRVEGGKASAFESGRQLDALQGHWHKITKSSTIDADDSRIGTQGGEFTGNGTDHVREVTTDGVNGTPRVADETRTVNQAIRIWERTA